MRRGLFLILCLLPLRAIAQVTSMDVAPTTLDLKPAAPALFFVTNHSARAVTVQIEAMDWRQEQNRDVLTPSGEFFASPPMVRIAPGARQSVRVMAKPAGDGEHAYRLLVSELPDAAQDGDGVHVLLQFSVPVFVRKDAARAPQLSWRATAGRLTAANSGTQAVKIDRLALNGSPMAGLALTYILPGAAHDFAIDARMQLHISAHEARSGTELAADVAP
jgi:fimbrial chaperone protein